MSSDTEPESTGVNRRAVLGTGAAALVERNSTPRTWSRAVSASRTVTRATWCSRPKASSNTA